MNSKHRCGKHRVNANPRSQIPIWTPCPVHRSHDGRVRESFEAIVGQAFSADEGRRLAQVVDSAMLD